MLDLGKDRICILVPGENFGVIIMMAQKVFNGGNEIRYAFEHPAAYPTLRQLAKPPLDHIQPRGAGWSEVKMETFVPLLPGFNLGVFMCRIVVADDMDFFARLDAAVDRIQKLDGINPRMASSLATAFKEYGRLDSNNAGEMKMILEKILAEKDLSNDTFEIISKTLKARE